LEDTDLESRVLWSFEDFVEIEAVECLVCVLACDGAVDEDGVPPGLAK
jgi:hypothetical protein